jgi:hypothetical protein
VNSLKVNISILPLYEIDFIAMLYFLISIWKGSAMDSMRNICGVPAIGIVAPIAAAFAVTQVEHGFGFDFCHKAPPTIR